MEEMNYIEEIVETEDAIEVMDPVEVETEDTGIGAGMVALITAGVAAAGVAAVHWGKKLWAKHKAKTELRKPDADKPVEVTEAMIEKVVAEDTDE